MESEGRDGPPRAMLIAAIVVAVGATIAVLAVAALRQRPADDRPVAIVTVPAPAAATQQCTTLTAALPDRLGDLRRAKAAEPAPPATAAWRTDADSEAVILRCGVDRPAEFVVGSPLQVVDEVSWLRVGEQDPASQGRTTWFAVDRQVYVALTLPPDSGPTPIQEISRVIAKSLPAMALDPAPAR